MRIGTLISSFALLCLIAACKIGNKDAASESGPAASKPRDGSFSADSASPFKAPEKYAAAFAGYRSGWARLTGYEFSGLHWGQFISLYVNKNPDAYIRNYREYMRVYVDADIDEASHAQAGHFESYAVGTIFLKENYRAESGMRSAPLTVTAMIKREAGYDSAIHDWEFVQFDTAGRILFNGDSRDAATQAMCIKCHGNIPERDLIFSTFYSSSPAEK
jgi:cytochrome P460